jgi:bifunctional N-acetylglucosamine-1-phosphate-uridyltransferase/glucosamine-1-phosphate-acetyltransferase GlmU-like protein
MVELRALVAAAGRGTRAGLPYPKTLYPVQGIPILVRLVSLLSQYDSWPTVVVSPSGEPVIADCLSHAGFNAWLVVQPQPSGMGDAVLRFIESPAFADSEHIVLVWGDIPFIQPETLSAIISLHFLHENDFTFATCYVESAYTIVSRDVEGNVAGVLETRENGITEPKAGERDIGLFIFRKVPVFQALKDDLPGKYGRHTGEHGFLYIIEHLVRRGNRVEAFPLATKADLISLNSLDDLAGIDLLMHSGEGKIPY